MLKYILRTIFQSVVIVLLLYIHEKIPISDEDHFDDISCQASLCILQTISTILINVYRPHK